MAAVDAEASIQPQNPIHSRRKRKKGRFIKQGYHKSERDDARRVVARAFLSGITLDSHLQSVGGDISSDVNLGPYSPRPTSVASMHSRVVTEDLAVQGSASIELGLKLYEIQLDFAQQTQHVKLTPSKSTDKSFEALTPAPAGVLNQSAASFESPASERPLGFANPLHAERRQMMQQAHSRWRSLTSTDGSSLVVPCGHSLQPYESYLGSNRSVATDY